MNPFINKDIWTHIVTLLDPISRNTVRATCTHLASLLPTREGKRILFANAVAKSEHFLLLKWCIESNFEHSSEICSNVKNIETLRYLKSNGCDWNSNCLINATSIEVLEYAKSSFRMSLKHSLHAAINRKDLEIIKWHLLEEPSLKSSLTSISIDLSTSNDFVILNEIRDFFGFKPLRMTAFIAVQINYLDFLINEENLDLVACVEAASAGGHIEIIKYLNTKGIPYSSYDLNKIAENKHYDLIKFLVEQGASSKSYKVCTLLASQNNIEMLQWAISKGFLVDLFVIRELAIHGNLEMMKVVFDHGLEKSIKSATFLPYISGKYDVGKFIMSRCLGSYFDVYIGAILSGNLNLIKRLRKEDCELWTEGCTAAALMGSIQILKWLRKHNTPWYAQTCVAAVKAGNLRVLKWIYNNGGEDLFISYSIRVIANDVGSKEIIEWLNKKTGHSTDDRLYIS